MSVSTILGAASLASNIFGGLMGARAAKIQQSRLEKAAREREESYKRRKLENQNWYDRRYYEDATQRADAQRMLTKTAEMIKARNKAAAGRAAVTGGTEESVAATKAANAQALSDAASRIASASEARKDRVEQQYQANKNDLDNAHDYSVAATNAQLGALDAQRAHNIASATQGVSKALGGLAGSIGEAGAFAKDNKGTFNLDNTVLPNIEDPDYLELLKKQQDITGSGLFDNLV